LFFENDFETELNGGVDGEVCGPRGDAAADKEAGVEEAEPPTDGVTIVGSVGDVGPVDDTLLILHLIFESLRIPFFLLSLFTLTISI
jgi:hypothetical protein